MNNKKIERVSYSNDLILPINCLLANMAIYFKIKNLYPEFIFGSMIGLNEEIPKNNITFLEGYIERHLKKNSQKIQLKSIEINTEKFKKPSNYLNCFFSKSEIIGISVPLHHITFRDDLNIFLEENEGLHHFFLIKISESGFTIIDGTPLNSSNDIFKKEIKENELNQLLSPSMGGVINIFIFDEMVKALTQVSKNQLLMNYVMNTEYL